MSDLLEILSPVGDMERLYAALDFGADAVYLGGTCFGMRAASANFDAQTLAQACSIVHERGKKLYLTCNTLPRKACYEYISTSCLLQEAVHIHRRTTWSAQVLTGLLLSFSSSMFYSSLFFVSHGVRHVVLLHAVLLFHNCFLAVFDIHLAMSGRRDLSAVQVIHLARLLPATIRQ